jgi:hypothetical protein
MKKSLLILILFLFTVAGIAQQGIDVITLKNGSVIRGRIVEQNDQLVKIYTTNRSMVELRPGEIEKMEKESSGSATQESQLSLDEDVTTQGNMILGGSAWLGYDRYKYITAGGKDSQFGLYLSPKVAWFIVDYLAVGTSLNLGFNVNSGDFSYSLGIGPLVKYYLDAGLFFSAQGSINFDHYPNKTSYTSFTLKPGLGYAIFLNPKVALEPALTYEFAANKYKGTISDSKDRRNSVGIEVGLTIFL